MYKLFLCLKYLRRRYLAIIAALAVALCVAMVLIVVSVMDGFLRQVEVAAKGLFGEIVVDSASLSGIGLYDEFISKLTGEYYLDADFVPVRLDGGKVVYRVEAPLSAVEAFNRAPGRAGAALLEIDKPLVFPARAALFRDGQKARELTGTLTLGPERRMEFAPANLPAGESSARRTRLGPLYVKVGEPMEEIEAVTPAIYTFGLMRIGDTFTTDVQICGIRLPERLAVTDFEKGLFVQAGRADANFDPSPEAILERLRQHSKVVAEVYQRELHRPEGRRDEDLIRRLLIAGEHLHSSIRNYELVLEERKLVGRMEFLLQAEQAKPRDQQDAGKIARLTKEIGELRADLNERFRGPEDRAILGVGIAGLSFRTPEGETIRAISPGRRVLLAMAPMGRGGIPGEFKPVSWTFVVADDAKTGVYQFDSKVVYVPFAKLQLLEDMKERRDIRDPTFVDPARCSQIQIKVKPEYAGPGKLPAVRLKVARAWRQFEAAHGRQAAAGEILIHTWREKLSKFIGPIQKQRSLVALMFGVISLVAVLLVFAVFYMIVMQKIRDIGVIRAVGGSPGGVAQIFLAFGAATGLVGSLVGLAGGWLFVHYINQVEDVLYLVSGERVWDKEVFLFDKIPNQVEPSVMLVIAAWAVASGLVGALIPAIWASIRAPAEVVRYE